MSGTLKAGITVEAIQAKMFSDLATIEDYAAALNKSVRTIWEYIGQGLPVTHIGCTPYIVVSKAAVYWAERARQHTAPQRGRPRKNQQAA